MARMNVTAAVPFSTTKVWYKPYRKWYHKSYYIIVWVLMEIVYSIFIGIISSKIARKIVGIGLQCRRDMACMCFQTRGCAPRHIFLQEALTVATI